MNVPLKIPEVFCSVFMREDESCIKISMRSQGEFSVRDLCERYFGGGGHIRAAGCTMMGSSHDVLNNLSKLIAQQLEAADAE